MHKSELKPGSLLKARGWDGALPSTEVYWEKAIISSHLETTVSQGILGWGKQAVDITSWAGNEPATCCLTLYWGHGGGLNGSNCKSPKQLDKQDERTHTQSHSHSECGCQNKWKRRTLKKRAHKAIRIVPWSMKCLEIKWIYWNCLKRL